MTLRACATEAATCSMISRALRASAALRGPNGQITGLPAPRPVPPRSAPSGVCALPGAGVLPAVGAAAVDGPLAFDPGAAAGAGVLAAGLRPVAGAAVPPPGADVAPGADVLTVDGG